MKHKCFFKRSDSIPVKAAKIALMVIGGMALAVLFAFIFGIAVKYIWNWLMPSIFGLPVITYWQALGLVILAKIFFGAFGHHGHHSSSRDHRSPHACYDKKYRNHYKQFWEEKGKDAFEEYVKGLEGDKGSS